VKYILAAIALLAQVNFSLADERLTEILQELELRESAVPMREMPGWAKPKKVLLFIDQPSRLAWFKEQITGVELIPASSPPEVAAKAGDVDVLYGFCDEMSVKAATKAQYVHSRFAGIELCAPFLARMPDLKLVTNMQRVSSPAIGEHAITLMMALSRGFDHYAVVQADQNFDQQAAPLSRQREIGGQTMLVVGLGGIGNSVAKRAHGLGMTVIATRNSSREKPDYVSEVGLSDELPRMIGRADVVVNALPLTDQTKGLFDAAMFARMKKGAYFINVGRGATVVQDDLIAALKNGTVGGAGLDVMTPEPLPKGHPLWTTPNVIITPHTSGFVDNAGDRLWVILREQLRRYVAGEKVFNVVDLKRGY